MSEREVERVLRHFPGVRGGRNRGGDPRAGRRHHHRPGAHAAVESPHSLRDRREHRRGHRGEQRRRRGVPPGPDDEPPDRPRPRGHDHDRGAHGRVRRRIRVAALAVSDLRAPPRLLGGRPARPAQTGTARQGPVRSAGSAPPVLGGLLRSGPGAAGGLYGHRRHPRGRGGQHDREGDQVPVKTGLGRVAGTGAPRGAGAAAVDMGPRLLVSSMLRYGVLLASLVIVGGLVFLLIQVGPRAFVSMPRTSISESTDLTSIRAVVRELLPPEPEAVIEAGILLLIVTPVLTVGATAIAFAMERDWLYVAITTFVFAMLLLGFALGRATSPGGG